MSKKRSILPPNWKFIFHLSINTAIFLSLPQVEWYYNGKKLPHGHRYRTFHDFGIVILDILYCYEENSGMYECRATNKYGSDVTKGSLKCASKTNLILESQLPEVRILKIENDLLKIA